MTNPPYLARNKSEDKKIFDKSDDSLMEIYKWGRDISLEHFEELYKKLGTKFDFYFFESEVASDSVKIIKEFLAKGLLGQNQQKKPTRFSKTNKTNFLIN